MWAWLVPTVVLPDDSIDNVYVYGFAATAYGSSITLRIKVFVIWNKK